MKRYFYREKMVADFMKEKHGLYSYREEHPALGEIWAIPDNYRDVLEPRSGDACENSDGLRGISDGFCFGPENQMAVHRDGDKVLHRNGWPFFWPKVEP